MMLGNIPKKKSVSLNSCKPLSPILPELPIIKPKAGETAKAGSFKKQWAPLGSSSLSETGQTEVESYQTSDRPSKFSKISRDSKTIVRAGLKGGTLVALGKKLEPGLKARKGSAWKESRLDNNTSFMHLGFLNRNVIMPKKAMTTPKENKMAIASAPTGKPRKIKLKMSEKKEAKKVIKIDPVRPKDLYWSVQHVSKNGPIVCSHLLEEKICDFSKKMLKKY